LQTSGDITTIVGVRSAEWATMALDQGAAAPPISDMNSRCAIEIE
jgi:hypothetical protein